MRPARSAVGSTPESMSATPTPLPFGASSSRPRVLRRRLVSPSDRDGPDPRSKRLVGVTTASDEIERTSGFLASSRYGRRRNLDGEALDRRVLTLDVIAAGGQQVSDGRAGAGCHANDDQLRAGFIGHCLGDRQVELGAPRLSVGRGRRDDCGGRNRRDDGEGAKGIHAACKSNPPATGDTGSDLASKSFIINYLQNTTTSGRGTVSSRGVQKLDTPSRDRVAKSSIS